MSCFFLYCACDRKLNNYLIEVEENAIYIKMHFSLVRYNRAVRHWGVR